MLFSTLKGTQLRTKEVTKSHTLTARNISTFKNCNFTAFWGSEDLTSNISLQYYF